MLLFRSPFSTIDGSCYFDSEVKSNIKRLRLGAQGAVAAPTSLHKRATEKWSWEGWVSLIGPPHFFLACDCVLRRSYMS